MSWMKSFVSPWLARRTVATSRSSPGRNRFIAPVTSALDYAHGRGVIHRDVKPSNIMVQPDGTPKIMDFGLAHIDATVMTRAGQALGSPAYMSPEQVLGVDLSPKADLYSLAVVTYELITGRRPFEGKNITTLLHKVVHETPIPPRHWAKYLPDNFDAIFEQALAKEPSDRFADGAEFVTALNLRELEDLILPSPIRPAPAKVTVDDDKETLELGTPNAPPGETAASATGRASSRKKRLPVSSRVLVAGAAAATLLLALILWALVPRTTSFRIETEPVGALIVFDGREVGTSPVELQDLSFGPHEVRVVHEGFVPVDELVEIAEDSALSLKVYLQRATASLLLRSEPANADVLLNGEPLGTTPLEGVTLDPGPYQITVQKRGYRDWSREGTAKSGESLQMVARLERATRRRSAPAQSAETPPKPAPGEVAEARAVREGDLVELGAEVQPPKRVSGSFPRYPDAARRRREEGAVTVEMIVTETGETEGLRVIESASPTLDQAVLNAVKDWRFEPAVKDGVRVKVRWRVRQKFRMSR